MAEKLRVLAPPRESKIESLRIPIIGTAPLIVHRFSEKAKREMLEKQMKVPRGLKDSRNPQQEAADGEHLTKDGLPAFPVVGLKACIVSAARLLDFKMTDLRQAIAVSGDESAPLKAAFDGAIARDLVMEVIVPPQDRNIREDVTRIAGGTAMLRYRYEYRRWAAIASISFNSEFLSDDQLAQLIQTGGQTVGLGEWRPENNGVYGTFRLGSIAEVDALKGERDKAMAKVTPLKKKRA